MIRVLLVEDNVLLARTLGRQLSRQVDVVDAVDSAEAALRRLEVDAVDLVITDHDLGPGMTGLAFARISRERWPELPVIMLSGSLDVDTLRARAHAEGVRACVAKPASMPELARIIDEICRRTAKDVTAR